LTEDLEAIRLGYRPDADIRVLLIGESPPPGRGFFYTGDSTLFRASVPVFAERCGFPSDPEAFLRRFAGEGFYLDDLSTLRGDHPGDRPDADDVKTSLRRLAGMIDEHRPVVVVGVLDRICSLVERVVALSSEPGTPVRCLPFPYWKSESAKREYQRGLRDVLEEFGCSRGPA